MYPLFDLPFLFKMYLLCCLKIVLANGVSETDFASFMEYVGYFLANLGNYTSFGDKKIIVCFCYCCFLFCFLLLFWVL